MRSGDRRKTLPLAVADSANILRTPGDFAELRRHLLADAAHILRAVLLNFAAHLARGDLADVGGNPVFLPGGSGRLLNGPLRLNLLRSSLLGGSADLGGLGIRTGTRHGGVSLG